jgi:hypothetical protein
MRAEQAGKSHFANPLGDFLADSSNFENRREIRGHPRRHAKHRDFGLGSARERGTLELLTHSREAMIEADCAA